MQLAPLNDLSSTKSAPARSVTELTVREWKLGLLLGFIVWLVVCTPRLTARTLNVAPGGSDQNDGSENAPFATITKARDTIRAWRAAQTYPAEGVTVLIAGGSYSLAETLTFDERDSGSPEHPVVYKSQPGQKVSLNGALALDPGSFKKITLSAAGWNPVPSEAQSEVYVYDLHAQGITDLGSLRPRGFEQRDLAPAELSVNGQLMTLAQWPNVGEPLALTGDVNSPTQFVGSERTERWTQADDLWLHGLWAQTWADFHVKSSGVDVEKRLINLLVGPAQYGMAAAHPYYVYNLLEELDRPNEYYIDRRSGLLYFWPPSKLSGGRILLSMLNGPLVRIAGASYLVFQNLTVEAGRNSLLEITSGSHVLIQSCEFLNAGQYAVLVEGTDNGLDRCDIQSSGEEGILIRGGVRSSLTPGRNFISNSRINHTGRTTWCYRPGVSFDGGCGNVASHNLLEEMPHAAILFKGDEHLIEFNEIGSVCKLTSDAGAIYSGHDWGYRGNVIRHNYFHDVGSESADYVAHGVYLDDCMSGTIVQGNIFFKIKNTAVFCGGGRDNVITNNIVAQCGEAHFNDDRGRTRMNNVSGDYWNLLERLSADGILYQANPRASAFPECAAIPNAWDQVQSGLWRNPEHCVFSWNVGWGNSNWAREDNSTGTGVFSLYRSLEGNNPAQSALFDETTVADRELRPAFLGTSSAHFKALPFRAIGPSRAEEVSTEGGMTEASHRIEIERVFTVLTDLAKNGNVGVSKGELDSEESVRLYDQGDGVRVPMEIKRDGLYSLRFRVRSGGTTGQTGFWPDGYSFKVDGKEIKASGDPASVSPLDNAYGGCYWGTMATPPRRFTAGIHQVDIIAGSAWAVADYLEVIPQAENRGTARQL